MEGHTEEELRDRLNLAPESYRSMFRSLEDLILQVARYDLAAQMQEDDRLLGSAQNAAEEVTVLLLVGVSRLRGYHPQYFAQLQRNYPAVWEIYSTHTQHHTFHKIYEVFNKGVMTGIFRKDLNLELVTKICIAQLNMLLNPSLFPPSRYNPAEVFRSIFLYYTRGICTEQGGKMAEAYFAKISL